MKQLLPQALLLLLTITSVFGQSSTDKWVWATAFGDIDNDLPYDLVTASDGSIYVAGQTGADTLTGAPNWAPNNILLAKYSPDGQLLWSKEVGGQGRDIAQKVAVDAQGNVYIAGAFDLEANMGQVAGVDVILRSSSGLDPFLAKFTAEGQLVWAKSFDSEGGDAISGLSVDDEGRLVVVGNFLHGVLIEDIELTSVGLTASYMAAFTTDGDLRWAKALQADGWFLADAFSQGVDGSLLVAGRFADTLRTGGVFPAPIGKTDNGSLIVLRFRPEDGLGHPLFIAEGGTIGHKIGGIDMDTQQNIVLAGQFSGAFHSHHETATAQGLEDIFVLKVERNGGEAWLRTGGGPGIDDVQDLLIDDQNAIYLTGGIAGRGGFGNLTLPSAIVHAYNGYVVRYSPNGQANLLLETPSLLSQTGRAISLDTNGDLLLTGWFVDNLMLGNTTLRGQGMQDLFLTKYDLGVATPVQEPLQNNRLVLAPNPATTEVQVDLRQLEGAATHLLLTNSIGQVLYTQAVTQVLQPLPLNVPAGIYLVQVQGEYGKLLAVKKLVVR